VTAVEPLPGVTRQTQAPFPARYAVRVATLAYFLGPVGEAELTLTVPDLGMYGYPFAVDEVYFIPLRDGRLTPVSLCEAISPLPEAGLEQSINQLVRTARDHGVPAGRIEAEPVRQLDAPARPPEDRTGLRVAAASGISLLGAGGVVLLVVRLLRRTRPL
jgi:hypothetical protein